MWKLDKKGQPTKVMCDFCGEAEASPQVRVANVIVAELCDEHARTVTIAIKALLKTKPGPPDRCPRTSDEKLKDLPKPRCKLDANHDGDCDYE